MGDFEEVFMLHAVIMVCFLVPTPLGVVRASEHFEKKMSRMTPPGTRTLGATNAIVKAPGVRGGQGGGVVNGSEVDNLSYWTGQRSAVVVHKKEPGPGRESNPFRELNPLS